MNHNLRGEESERDEKFCRELCKGLGVELYVESVDVKKYCVENKVSTELGARQLRYEAVYRRAGDRKIATAHTLSDCLETAIFNLSRGSGVHGIASVPPVRGRLIRPLIDCTREEIEKYLSEKGQSFMTDSTNLLPDCSRNIIRLNIIPELKKINPGLMQSFYNTVNALREADGYITAEAERILLRAPDFSGISDGAALSRALGMYLRENNIEPSYERIASLKKIIFEGGRINPAKDVYIRSIGGRIRIERGDNKDVREYKVTLRENAEVGDKKIVVTKISPFDMSCYQKKELRCFIDCYKMSEEYTVRHTKGNEKIRLAGRGFTSTVKKLLSAEERRDNLVISDGEGVIFVEGAGVSERAACDENTSEALKIEIIKSTDIKEREK